MEPKKSLFIEFYCPICDWEGSARKQICPNCGTDVGALKKDLPNWEGWRDK